MAFDYINCQSVFYGQIVPVIFEVYSESGIPFILPEEYGLGDFVPVPMRLKESTAWCVVKDEEGLTLNTLPTKLIATESTKKTMMTSWDTRDYECGYYRLQVWCAVNISNEVDAAGNPVIEAKLASEDILRNIKEP